ncbi:MAG TPA: phage holin family protein [Propionibacteriaceae bacterium]|nr:phage holin family protein [Propionibacteriaceae bacterium]
MADLAVGDIIKNITDDVKLLVQDQVELAKAELTPAAKKGGTGLGLFGVAGYFALSASILLYVAAAFGLVNAGLAPWLAFLIVGVALLLIAGILGGVGYLVVRKIKGPDRTIAQAKQSVAEVKEAAQHAVAAANAPQIEGQVVPPTKEIT